MKVIQAVDLFCGGGGTTEGFIMAGAEVVLAVDVWAEALKLHEANHPDVEVMEYELGKSITLTASMIRSRLSPDAHFHLHGSPPCQALSNASRHDAKDGMGMVKWFFRLVEYMKPDSWSMENVVPVGKHLRELGIDYQVVNAADYGVPQARKRVFAGEGWTLTPTHSKENHVGVIDALPHLLDEEVPDLHMDSGRSSAPSSGVNPKTGKKEGGSGFLSKSVKNPSYTIMSTPKNLVDVSGQKVKRIRSLTIEESATLQGYSDLKVPEGIRKSDQWKIVGNMVCPPVAYAIIKGLHL
tara:strand:- start:178 stop:1065 length:888 start_codon:yes stop_codon:yes gene_type:complete